MNVLVFLVLARTGFMRMLSQRSNLRHAENCWRLFVHHKRDSGQGFIVDCPAVLQRVPTYVLLVVNIVNVMLIGDWCQKLRQTAIMYDMYAQISIHVCRNFPMYVWFCVVV